MNAPLVAGFDLGGTQLKYGLIDSRGNLVFKSKAPSPEKIDDLMALFEELWGKLKARGMGPIAAAGFGVAGFFNQRERKIVHSPNYPSLDGYDLVAAFGAFIDVPLWIDNDANVAAFGEYKYGAGKGSQSLVLLTIGTGIGSGIILDGRLWQGKCGYAGELGHITINAEGDICGCGNRGCLETEASAPKIVKNYERLRSAGENLTSEDIYLKAKAGDEAAVRAFAEAGYYLGIGLGIVINFLNPETIILGGGVMTTGEFLMEPAVEEARRRSNKVSFDCCSIRKASLGNDAGLIGAAAWAQEMVSQTAR